MPMWRCPHCGTPQAETARCWVCRRSSTACGTCRNFRRSVAAQLGYCGLDRQRRPLKGDEIRACWEAGAGPGEPPATGIPRLPQPADAPDEHRTPVRRLEFVEVQSTGPGRSEKAAQATTADAGAGLVLGLAGATDELSVAVGAIAPAWSLWGDGDL